MVAHKDMPETSMSAVQMSSAHLLQEHNGRLVANGFQDAASSEHAVRSDNRFVLILFILPHGLFSHMWGGSLSKHRKSSMVSHNLVWHLCCLAPSAERSVFRAMETPVPQELNSNNIWAILAASKTKAGKNRFQVIPEIRSLRNDNKISRQ